MQRHLCPECNIGEDVEAHNNGFSKNNREYVLVFMYSLKYLREGKWISPSVYYCHECGHVEKQEANP